MNTRELPDDELRARLIRAGMRETPSQRTLQRTLAGLGLAASALGTVGSAGALGATKAAASVTALALAKWAGVGAAAGLVLATAAHGVYRASVPAAPAPSHSAPSSEPSVAPGLPQSAVISEPLPVATSSSLALRVTPPRPVHSAPGGAELESPLAAELAFVDSGREAYQRNDPAGALARLDGYERFFPHQRLIPEVLYLRMQALRQAGDTRRAAEVAARLIRDFPKSPHASSARALLSERTVR